MLSKQSRKLLRWIARKNFWMTKQEIQESCKHFQEISFQAIKEKDYLIAKADENDIWKKKYHISDTGKAYLEGAQLEKSSRAREWMALLLSIVALLTSDPAKVFFGWLLNLFS